MPSCVSGAVHGKNLDRRRETRLDLCTTPAAAVFLAYLKLIDRLTVLMLALSKH